MSTIIATSPEDIQQLEQKIQELEERCSKNLTSLIKASTLIELFKQDEAKLKAEIAKIKNERDFLNECFDKTLAEQNVERAFLDVFLDETEAIWDRTKELASYEIAVHYLAAAQHRRNQGRTGDRISEIQNWIDSNGQPV